MSSEKDSKIWSNLLDDIEAMEMLEKTIWWWRRENQKVGRETLASSSLSLPQASIVTGW